LPFHAHNISFYTLSFAQLLNGPHLKKIILPILLFLCWLAFIALFEKRNMSKECKI
jgi:hypothetical protein